MASMMAKLTVGELKELLVGMDDNDYIGHLFSTQEDRQAPEHQVLVFFEPIKPL